MSRIYCPQCQWKPASHDRWICEPSCAHRWNTFDTRGQCPKCRKQWHETQCRRCHETSPHLDWYHDDGSDDLLRSLLEGETAPVAQPEKTAV